MTTGEDELRGLLAQTAVRNERPQADLKDISILSTEELAGLDENLEIEFQRREAEARRRLEGLQETSAGRHIILPVAEYPTALRDVLLSIPSITSPETPVSLKYGRKKTSGNYFFISWEDDPDTEVEFSSLEIQPFSANTRSRSKVVYVEPVVLNRGVHGGDPVLARTVDQATGIANGVMKSSRFRQLGFVEALIDLMEVHASAVPSRQLYPGR